ncbi:hypothetical protein AB0I28_00165 [Phytomonospora sp. NPDC050363]|uniref:hypothetical protein n=1 Tax=Phytomonospora sp. NPDC050363 TaxID=3155642 RepID=UPI0033C6D17D
MVGVLIGMKLAVLRNTATGGKKAWAALGATAGLTLAVATIVLSFLDFAHPRMLMDLLAVTFALWALGWAAGPAFTGEAPIGGHHFQRQPIPRRTLTLGLLASAMVAVTTLVTLLAFTALVVFAARLSPWAVAVAIPAAILLLLLVVLASRVVSLLFATLASSRLGGVVTASVTAAMVALASFSWVVFIAVYILLEHGFPARVSTVLRALPSSWGLLSVEAASRGDWWGAAGPLAGLAVLAVALFGVWSRLLGTQPITRAVVRGSSAEWAAPRGWAARGDLGLFYLRELRTWWRDPLRTQNITLPVVFALLTALFPVTLDYTGFFPFAGAGAAVMGAATCANLYGQDGTALWMTLTVPGKEKADVRARQLAWLTVFGPMTLAMTVAGVVVHGEAAMLPWALAANLAALGAGAGLLVWIAVVGLVPGPDPHRSKHSPLDHGDVTGQSLLMFLLTSVAILPALGVALAGHLLGQAALTWASVPVAIVVGAAAYLGFGRLAAGRLAETGPELLQLMRTGKRPNAAAGTVRPPTAFETMGAGSRLRMWGSMAVGIIALFPQGLVPLGIKLDGSPDKVWFLALYLPEAWQWPTIAVMILIGLAGFGGMFAVYRAETRRVRAD